MLPLLLLLPLLTGAFRVSSSAALYFFQPGAYQ
jgi:hypothetical protein